MATEVSRGIQKTRQGIVVSDKMEKTIVVAVTRQVKNTTYGKYIRQTNKYYAHDAKDEAKVGDVVRISETRPTSKLKRWKLEEILVRAE